MIDVGLELGAMGKTSEVSPAGAEGAELGVHEPRHLHLPTVRPDDVEESWHDGMNFNPDCLPSIGVVVELHCVSDAERNDAMLPIVADCHSRDVATPNNAVEMIILTIIPLVVDFPSNVCLEALIGDFVVVRHFASPLVMNCAHSSTHLTFSQQKHPPRGGRLNCGP